MALVCLLELAIALVEDERICLPDISRLFSIAVFTLFFCVGILKCVYPVLVL